MSFGSGAHHVAIGSIVPAQDWMLLMNSFATFVKEVNKY